MQAIQRSIAIARRRILYQQWLTAMGWALLASLLTTCALLSGNRLASLQLPTWGYLIAPGICLIVATWLALSRWPDDLHVATLIDQRLGLNDQIATALYAADLPDALLAQQVVDDAQRTAGRTAIAPGFKIKFKRVWLYVPPALVILLLLLWLLAPADLFGLKAKRQQKQQQQAAAQQAQQEIADAAKQIEQIKKEGGDGGKGEFEGVPGLAELSQQDLSTHEARREAAAELSDAAKKLGEQAQQKQGEADATKNMLSRMQPNQAGPATRFANAVRRSDFDTAQQELKQLADQADSLPPQEKKQLASQLKDMSDQLQTQSQKQQLKQEKARQQAEEALKQAGLDQKQIEDLKKQDFDKKAVEKKLKENGNTPQQAKKTAKQVQKQQQTKQTAKKTADQSKGLSSSLGKMSKAVSGQAKKQGSKDGKQGPSRPTSGKKTPPKPSPQKKPTTGQGKDGQKQQPSQKKSSQQPGQNEKQSAKKSGGSKPQQQKSGQDGKPSSKSAGTQQAAKQVNQQLKQMAQSQQQANQMRQAQQRTEQAMQKMAGRQGSQSKGASPPPSGQASSSTSIAKGYGSGKQRRTRPPQPIGSINSHKLRVDSKRRSDSGGKVMTSWTDKGEPAKGEAAVEFNTAVTQATADAEKAINDDRVPKKYHGPVADYFKQLPKPKPEP